MAPYKALRLGIEYNMSVAVQAGLGVGAGTVYTTKHRVWMKPVGTVSPGDLTSAISVQLKNGATANLGSEINRYFAEMVQYRYRVTGAGPNMTPGDVEVVLYPEHSDTGLFITTHAISGWTALGGGNNAYGRQLIATFRTIMGNGARLVYMHGNTVEAVATALPASNAFAAWCLAGDSPLTGIDGTAFNGSIKWLPGSNERMFKKATNRS